MLLKIGSTGEDVKKLQAHLGLSADGLFGPGTEKSVKVWQSDHGLTADGVVGAGTWSKMFTEQVSVVTAATPVVGGTNLQKLQGHMPAAVITQIPQVMEKFQINTALRLCHFLAQCGHESNNFTAVTENLNYGAKALQITFKKYFPTEAKALEYERKPEKIANLVYGGRMDNGPEASGDGYKFRGRGFIQLTGKVNYVAFGKSIGEDIAANPDVVATKYPLLSAAWYWNSRNINKVCDKGDSDAVTTEITKLVNGGTIGLDDRIKHFKRFYALVK